MLRALGPDQHAVVVRPHDGRDAAAVREALDGLRPQRVLLDADLACAQRLGTAGPWPVWCAAQVAAAGAHASPWASHALAHAWARGQGVPVDILAPTWEPPAFGWFARRRLAALARAGTPLGVAAGSRWPHVHVSLERRRALLVRSLAGRLATGAPLLAVLSEPDGAAVADGAMRLAYTQLAA